MHSDILCVLNSKLDPLCALDCGAGKSNKKKGTVVFLHGAPTQSYSYRDVLAQVKFLA